MYTIVNKSKAHACNICKHIDFYICKMKSTQRYYSPEKFSREIGPLKALLLHEVLGYSVENRPIEVLRLGTGPIKILMWSQMHGNESSSTRALIALLEYFTSPNGKNALEGLQLAIIPQLNPDGAQAYTRLNANGVDLNRDAQELTQPESVILQDFCRSYAPDYAFNLHGQRTIFGAGDTGAPATLSFLAPAGDAAKTISSARLQAMHLIADIQTALQVALPHAIGRYDDSFNLNCVGDTFTHWGIPTLLFESGHFPEDYDRNITVDFTFKALKLAIEHIKTPNHRSDVVKDYHKIPENSKNWVDLIISPLSIGGNKEQQLALQLEEQLINDEIHFIPRFLAFGSALNFKAHKYITLHSDNSGLIIPENQLESWNYNNLLMNYL